MNLVEIDTYRDPIVVVTRPFPDCTRTAQQAEEVGFDTFEEPLGVVSYVPLDDVKLPDHVNLILTSHRAVPSLKNIPFNAYPSFYVVGERTAHTLHQHGFEGVQHVAATAENLKDWLIKRKEELKNPFLYVRGRDITLPLTKILGKEGFDISEKTVYAVDGVDDFSDEFKALLEGNRQVVILLTSRRTAEQFLSLEKKNRKKIRAPIRYLCFSPKIAETIDNKSEKLVEFCDDPTEDALIQKLMLMYDEKI